MKTYWIYGKLVWSGIRIEASLRGVAPEGWTFLGHRVAHNRQEALTAILESVPSCLLNNVSIDNPAHNIQSKFA